MNRFAKYLQDPPHYFTPVTEIIKVFFYLADLQIAQKSATRGTKNNFIKWNTY